jgi:hypothetical protein
VTAVYPASRWAEAALLLVAATALVDTQPPASAHAAWRAVHRLLSEPQAGAGELAQVREELKCAQADYAAIRGLARRLFAEDSTDQDALALFRIVETVDHPGAPFTIRYNRAKAVVEAARTHDNGTIDDALYAYDAPLKEESNDHTTAT